jgi:hypothetical protein
MSIVVTMIIIMCYLYSGYLQLIPETNHVSRAILYLQFMLYVMLFPMLNVPYFTSVLSAVCVQCPTWLFCVVL